MAKPGRTTDVGTVVLHTILVTAFFVALATGLRIATDDPDLEWLRPLDPVLPTEHLFWRHLVSGVVLMAVLAGHLVYVRQAKLERRTRIDKGRILALLSAGPNRWSALNVIVFRVLVLALYTVTASGLLLFAGYGGAVFNLHVITTVLAVACVGFHVLLHLAYGGLNQILRIVRPVPLEIAPDPPDLAELLAQELASKQRARQKPPEAGTPSAVEAPGDTSGPKPLSESISPTQAIRRTPMVHAHPLSVALAMAIAVGLVAVGTERTTRQTLEVPLIKPENAPTLDGDLSDPVWSHTKPGRVLTTQGGDFGETHESAVEIRAAHDGIFAYFALIWDDPTRSLKHMPLVKKDGSWHVVASRPDLADEKAFNEDKFSVLLVGGGLPLIGGAIHLANQPLDDKPPGSTGRGLHFVRSGGFADVWLWRAAHGGLIGHVDNCHFGGPDQRPDPSLGPTAVYSGGFACDPATTIYRSNIAITSQGKQVEDVRPLVLPRSATQMAGTLGSVHWRPEESDTGSARWWLMESETVPYTPALGSKLPDGTVIPSVLLADRLPESPTSIRGVARWNAGRWTLEMARRLYTNSPRDVPIKSGTLLWVAAFDHAEKRHTRHLRPFILRVE